MEGSNGTAAVAEPPQPNLDDLTVEGTVQLGLFDAGGKKPTGATLAISGGKVELVQGEAFRKGDRLRLTLDVVVNDVALKDHHDGKTGQVTSCTQHHKARILDVQVESALSAE